MDKKVCITCGVEKDIEEFSIHNKKNMVRRNQCMGCHNDARDERNRVNKAEKKAYMEELKKGSKCKKCGDSRPYVFDYHHLDPRQKEMGIGKILMGGSTVKRLKKELEKCIVLCASCHREFHYFEKVEGLKIEDYLS